MWDASTFDGHIGVTHAVCVCLKTGRELGGIPVIPVETLLKAVSYDVKVATPTDTAASQHA